MDQQPEAGHRDERDLRGTLDEQQRVAFQAPRESTVMETLMPERPFPVHSGHWMQEYYQGLAAILALRSPIKS